MNERITRVSLDEGASEDRSDWSKVEALTEAELDAAIAGDRDTWCVSDQQLSEAASRRPIYKIVKQNDGFAWRLVARDGEVIAQSGHSFGTLEEAEVSVAHLAAQVLGAKRQKAA